MNIKKFSKKILVDDYLKESDKQSENFEIVQSVIEKTLPDKIFKYEKDSLEIEILQEEIGKDGLPQASFHINIFPEKISDEQFENCNVDVRCILTSPDFDRERLDRIIDDHKTAGLIFLQEISKNELYLLPDPEYLGAIHTNDYGQGAFLKIDCIKKIII
jgi:hypothetical protein